MINGIVANRKVDAVDCGARSEQGGNRVWLTPVLPVGVGASFDGELKRGAVAGIEGIDGGAGRDERAYDFVMGAPGSDMEGGGVLGQFPIGISVGPERRGRDAESEQT